MHIAPPLTWRYGCMCSLFPSSLKFPPTGGIFLSGPLHLVSSLLIQLWLLHKLMRILVKLHVEKLFMHPLNHQVSNLFFSPQIFGCILYLKCIHVPDSHTDLFHLSCGDVSKENLSFYKYHIIAIVFQYRSETYSSLVLEQTKHLSV